VQKDVSTLRDLLGTAILTGLSVVATFAVIAVLARVLDEAQFLEFSVVSRYLGFLTIAANLGMAFSFIRFSEGQEVAGIHAVARLCNRYVLLATALFAAVWLVFVLLWQRSDWVSIGLLLLTYLWVASQARYHLSAPYARRISGFNGYRKLYVVAKIVAPLVGVIGVVFSESYQMHFIVFALVSLLYQQLLWRGNQTTAASAAEFPVLKFSKSRWIENIIRAALPVVFVLAAQLKGGAHFAGSVAIIFTVAKAIESVIQPLVVAIMVRVSSSSEKSTGLLMAIAIAIAIGVVVYLCQYWVFLFITTFLGENYGYLVREAWIVLMSAGAIISLSLLRALNDNKLDDSPLVWINLVCILLVPLIVYFANDLQQVAVGIVAIQLLRFALYGGALKLKLK